MLKSSQNIGGKSKVPGGLPTMDLSKLKKGQPRRNYVAVANTSRRMKEKDLLFIDQDFKGIGGFSAQAAAFKKSVINALSQTRNGFAKVKTPTDSAKILGQTSRSKFGATSTQIGFKAA